MSRSHTILIAVLLNIGVIAVLFATAVQTNDTPPAKLEGVHHKETLSMPSLSSTEPSPSPKLPLLALNTPPAALVGDDAAYGFSSPSAPHVQEVLLPAGGTSPISLSEAPQSFSSPSATDCIEVKVRPTDTLAKLARLNGISVEDIKHFNNLTSEQLTVGQTLRIPIETQYAARSAPSPAADVQAPVSGMEYYTVKSGDNPWSIANKHKIKVEELLKLNHLNKETARHLKPGDKLRIR